MSTADLLSHHRSRGRRRQRGDLAADRLRDVVGSWGFLAVATLAVAASTVLAISHDDEAGAVAVLGLLLSGLSVLGLVIVLMAAGRAARNGDRRAMHDAESARRFAAAIADLRDDVDGLRSDVVRISAGVHRSRPTAGS